MPNIPEPCEALATEVGQLELEDQTLRAQIPSLAGTALWSALARLGQTRELHERKHRELTMCIHDHTAALQANLVVMDLRPPNATAARVAHLWDAAQSTAPTETTAFSTHAATVASRMY